MTIFLIENLPDEIWGERIPGYKQKTIRMMGAHLHNCRLMWVKGVGKRFEVSAGDQVDRHRVSRRELAERMSDSGLLLKTILERSLAGDGKMPGFSPSEVNHFGGYMIAHEAHHRGQITMAARQLDHPIESDVIIGMWKWGKRRAADSR